MPLTLTIVKRNSNCTECGEPIKKKDIKITDSAQMSGASNYHLDCFEPHFEPHEHMFSAYKKSQWKDLSDSQKTNVLEKIEEWKKAWKLKHNRIRETPILEEYFMTHDEDNNTKKRKVEVTKEDDKESIIVVDCGNTNNPLNLPLEIWSLIFSYLRDTNDKSFIIDLVSNFSLINKDFYNLILNRNNINCKNLWKDIIYWKYLNNFGVKYTQYHAYMDQMERYRELLTFDNDKERLDAFNLELIKIINNLKERSLLSITNEITNLNELEDLKYDIDWYLVFIELFCELSCGNCGIAFDPFISYFSPAKCYFCRKCFNDAKIVTKTDAKNYYGLTAGDLEKKGVIPLLVPYTRGNPPAERYWEKDLLKWSKKKK
ncbi:hypothetical protein ABK040_003348 [Willaertia magna]